MSSSIFIIIIYLYSNNYNYGWSETAGFLTEEIILKYKELCEKSKNNKLTDNSVIYQSPISNYPVYKLKNYIQENKLNIKKARKLRSGVTHNSFGKSNNVIHIMAFQKRRCSNDRLCRQHGSHCF